MRYHHNTQFNNKENNLVCQVGAEIAPTGSDFNAIEQPQQAHGANPSNSINNKSHTTLKERQDLALRACQVKLYPDLNMAAFQTKQHKELVLWYRLRFLDIKSHGELDLDAALEGLVVVFHYSRNTLFKHLRLGEGKLWRREVVRRGCIIKIWGVFAAYRYFGITHKTDSHPRMIKVADFIGIKAGSSQICATIHKPVGIKANPKSRDSITDMTGLDRKQQWRYDEAARVKRTPTYQTRAIMNDKGDIIGSERVSMTFMVKGKAVTKEKRNGNQSHCRAVLAPRGQLKRINLTVRYKGESYVTGETSMLKRWFGSVKQVCKALKWKSGGVWTPPMVLVPNKYRVIRGRLEYAAISVI